MCYLLAARSGARAEALFLRSLQTDELRLVPLLSDDLARMAELVERYADLPLGTADASVVALAERLAVPDVATIDHRHFRVVRPRHARTLTLLP